MSNRDPNAAHIRLAVTVDELVALAEGLDLLAIEHHRQAVLTDDPAEATRHSTRERDVDQLRTRLDQLLTPATATT